VKRVMVACDRCGQIIQGGNEIEIYCASHGQESKLDLCPGCFREFLFGFIGIKGVNENDAGKEANDPQDAEGKQTERDSKPEVAGEKRSKGN